MSFRAISTRLLPIILLVGPALVSATFCASVLAQSPPNIRISGYPSAEKVQRRRSIQGVVEMEIPAGFHVNSSRPLEKFLIATQLQIEAPPGVRVGPVSYPRAMLRSLKFSKNKVSVYEGKVTMRFNISVPASFSSDSFDLKGRLHYQSCNDEVCFPPQTRELTFSVKVGK